MAQPVPIDPRVTAELFPLQRVMREVEMVRRAEGHSVVVEPPNGLVPAAQKMSTLQVPVAARWPMPCSPAVTVAGIPSRSSEQLVGLGGGLLAVQMIRSLMCPTLIAVSMNERTPTSAARRQNPTSWSVKPRSSS